MSKSLVTVAELSATVETLVNQTHVLQAEARARPIKWTTQIYDLGEQQYILLEPLLVLIEEYPDEGNVIARLPELETFGEGSTISEALLGLKNAMLDLYDELINEESQSLGNLPQTWLRILQRIIHKV
jgi:hypothetical protein